MYKQADMSRRKRLTVYMSCFIRYKRAKAEEILVGMAAIYRGGAGGLIPLYLCFLTY